MSPNKKKEICVVCTDYEKRIVSLLEEHLFLTGNEICELSGIREQMVSTIYKNLKIKGYPICRGMAYYNGNRYKIYFLEENGTEVYVYLRSCSTTKHSIQLKYIALGKKYYRARNRTGGKYGKRDVYRDE